jgi:hypothetical protein
MAFPIIPRKRSGATGHPSSLNVGELAVNTATGELFLGGDSAVLLLNPPTAAGTTVTEHTGDGTTVAFTFTGYNGTADGGYIVSVGGIDQPPSKYAVTSTAGGTITFVEAPVDGELISIRAIVAGSGGGGSGDATSLQGRSIATTAPTNGQVLAWNATTSKWEPQGGGGSVTFNTVGTHLWSVPASVRYAHVNATAGDGSAGTAGTNGAAGESGTNAYFDNDTQSWVAPTTGVNGANGDDGVDGASGKSISLAAISLALAGGTGGAKGLKGFGGGGSGGGGAPSLFGAVGASGNGTTAGGGGGGGGGDAFGGAAGGGNATAGTTGGPAVQGLAGTGDLNGGAGGDGGFGGSMTGGGGGGGGGYDRSGGGGGGGSSGTTQFPGPPGTPGLGGTGTQGTAGAAGQTFNGAANFSAYAGGQVSIVISEGAGNASITITW